MLQQQLGHPVTVKELRDVKFLKIITPEVNETLCYENETLHHENETLHYITVRNEHTVYAKMKILI